MIFSWRERLPPHEHAFRRSHLSLRLQASADALLACGFESRQTYYCYWIERHGKTPALHEPLRAAVCLTSCRRATSARWRNQDADEGHEARDAGRTGEYHNA